MTDGKAASASSPYVLARAIAWANNDPLERWAIGGDAAALPAEELRETIANYLAANDPFPNGTSVWARGLDADEHEEGGVIIDRPGPNEWTVEFGDGTQAWRGSGELRPAEF